ncbi:MAG: lysophospholipid acyltransferase family protein, partial [Candidatus Neomarinimicrobiota bacterium]
MRLVLVPSLRLLFRPRVIGKKHLPVAGPCFIIANHSNLYDGFIINVFLFEPTASVMVEEYFRGGFLAWVFKKIGLVPTRKFQPQATPVRELMRFIKDNRMIIIMPEGERNWDGVTRPTVAATGKLFRRLGLPVYPVIMHNGYLAWPGWARWPRRFKIVVDFRPPLQFTPDMTDEQVAEMVDSAVQWDPQRDMARYSDRVPNGFRPADGITSLIFRC